MQGPKSSPPETPEESGARAAANRTNISSAVRASAQMKQTITNPVRAAREDANLTQITVCLRARISLSTLRNAERGYASKFTLAKIAQALGVDVDVLTGRKAAA